VTFCKINNIKLYYEDHGAKDQTPLIFLHGLMSNVECWKPQVDRLKDKKRIIVFDLRGHGRSDKPLGKYSIKQFSEDLFSFMKNLEIEKAQEMVLMTPKHVVASCFSAVKDFDVTSELASIRVPTLIIHGSEDTQQPLS